MAFFVPFVLGAAAAAAGIHIYKNRGCCCCGEDCSCGCEDGKCECDSDCDCGCNDSSFKKKAADKADIALEKIKSGLKTLEGNISEASLEKIKSSLQNGIKTVEDKIADLQSKLKEEKVEEEKV